MGQQRIFIFQLTIYRKISQGDEALLKSPAVSKTPNQTAKELLESLTSYVINSAHLVTRTNDVIMFPTRMSLRYDNVTKSTLVAHISIAEERGFGKIEVGCKSTCQV